MNPDHSDNTGTLVQFPFPLPARVIAWNGSLIAFKCIFLLLQQITLLNPGEPIGKALYHSSGNSPLGYRPRRRLPWLRFSMGFSVPPENDEVVTDYVTSVSFKIHFQFFLHPSSVCKVTTVSIVKWSPEHRNPERHVCGVTNENMNRENSHLRELNLDSCIKWWRT
jgi:hypothetical protein